MIIIIITIVVVVDFVVVVVKPFGEVSVLLTLIQYNQLPFIIIIVIIIVVIFIIIIIIIITWIDAIVASNILNFSRNYDNNNNKY